MTCAEFATTTNFSFLRGASHPEEMVLQASHLGLAGIGIADRNSVAGAVRAHTAMRETGAGKTGFKLAVGARLVFADGTPDIIAYPESRAGWGRLCRLLTLGNLRARKGDCILHLDDLLDHLGELLMIVMPSRAEKEIVARETPHPDRWRDPTSPIGRGEDGIAASEAHLSPAGRGRFERNEDRVRGQGQSFGAMSALLRRLNEVAPGAVWLAAAMNRRGGDRRRLAGLKDLSARAGVPLIATNDVLYHHPDRRPLQDVVTCIREHMTIETAGRRLQANAERYLKPPEEMARLFADAPEAVAETMRLLERIRFSLDEIAYCYPQEPVPPGRSAQSHLEELTWEGAAERFADGVPDKVAATLRKELALIAQLNYAPYFLTVHDIVRFARSQGILCQGRGSAANSAVCYVLGITAVDPTEIDLLFERFVSAERREPPDIDVDFEHERREEVIQYIYRRYGRARAGIAATVISYRPKSAIREVGKALGLSEDMTGALARTVWGAGGREFTDARIAQAGLDPANPAIRQTVRLAAEILGFPRHLSQHVGGFVLTRDRLDDTVPIANAAMEDRTFIEWDKDDLDALGLLKVDVLGLGMLTCIRKAFSLLAEHEGIRHDLASVPRDDAAVYEMLQKADSLGVFQVESRAQMNMLPRLRPECFYDLVIEVAIVRPGPIQGDMVHPYLRRRQGKETVGFPSPAPEHGDPDELRRVLGKTLGVPLFQEQAMRIAIEAAKFTPEEANQLRRAMATFRRAGTIHTFEQKMVEGMVARGYDRDFAERCFKQIEGFGTYGFPESHAASFAHLVYVSAWLKCRHPAVFACALLNSQPMGFYAPAQIVRDAREHGVEVRSVDVGASRYDNTLERVGGWHEESYLPLLGGGRRPQGAGWGASDGRFTPPRTACGDPTLPFQGREGAHAATPERSASAAPDIRLALRLGFRQVDGFREVWADAIVAARQQGFADVESLLRRAGLPRHALLRLAGADAFRSLGLDRRGALWAVKRLPDDEALPLFAAAAARELAAEPDARLPDMALSEHVIADYQTLRLSLKGHPMEFLRGMMRSERVLTCAQATAGRDGARVRTAGVVLVRQRPGTAAGVVFMTIEDETGIANVVIWPNMLERFRREVMGSRLILVAGRIQRSPEGIVHIVAARLVDRSGELSRLSAQRSDKPFVGNVDDIVHGKPRPADHPRKLRIIPKPREFH